MTTLTLRSSAPAARTGETEPLDVAAYVRARLTASGSMALGDADGPEILVLGKPLVGGYRVLTSMRLGDTRQIDLQGITEIIAQWSGYSGDSSLTPLTLEIDGQGYESYPHVSGAA